MKKFLLFLSLIFWSFNANAKINIIACEQEWGSVAREIAGARAKILTIVKGNENPASLTIQNWMVNLIRNADMIFCNGAEAESSWLENAIKQSDNKKLLDDERRILWAADYSVKKFKSQKMLQEKTVLKDNTKIIPSFPRLHLNPHNVISIAGEFTRRVKLLDSANSDFYQKSYENFLQKYMRAILVWEEMAKPLKGMKIIVMNNSWNELIDWLQLDLITQVEPQKGEIFVNQEIINEGLESLKDNEAQVMIFGGDEDRAIIMAFYRRANLQMVQLPLTVNSGTNSANLAELYSTIVKSLLRLQCRQSFCPAKSVFQP